MERGKTRAVRAYEQGYRRKPEGVEAEAFSGCGCRIAVGGLGVRRDEVWWVNFPAPVGRRPAVLVSRNQADKGREAVTVVPLTTQI